MNLSEYLSGGRGRLSALAREIGAAIPNVSDWGKGKRPIPFEYGAPIERATGGMVTREEMFPDDWATWWPELIARNQEKANA